MTFKIINSFLFGRSFSKKKLAQALNLKPTQLAKLSLSESEIHLAWSQFECLQLNTKESLNEGKLLYMIVASCYLIGFFRLSCCKALMFEHFGLDEY